MQKNNFSRQSIQTVSYITTNAFATVPQFSATAIKDGRFDIKCSCGCYNDTAGDTTICRLALNGAPFDGIVAESYSSGTGSTPVTLIALDIPLRIGDIITLQAKYVGSATEIRFAANVSVGGIKIVKRGE